MEIMNTDPTLQPSRPAPVRRIRPAVALQVPAEGVYLSVIRSSAVALAARANLTLDELEDLRIAVSEAGSLLLSTAVEHSLLEAEVELQPDGVRVLLHCSAASLVEDLKDSFAWTVLTTLVDEVRLESDTSSVTFELVKRREVRQ